MSLLKKSGCVIFALLIGLGSYAQNKANKSFTLPTENNDGIEVLDLKKVIGDTIPILDLINKIRNNTHGDIHSLLILKNNKLIIEEYFNNVTRDSEQLIYSITKSYASILVGLCIEKGYFKSDSDFIVNYLPEVRKLNLHNGVEKIRINHLLTMTSGLDFGKDSWSRHDTIDHVLNILKSQEKVTPGITFAYSDMNAHIMGHLITNAIHDKIENFAETFLFNPLGIKNYEWQGCICPVKELSDCFYVKSRDLAKLGILMLNEGQYNKKQLINKEWIKKITQTHQIIRQYRGNYGYFWFTNTFDFKGIKISAYSSGGARGQFLLIIPDYSLIIIFTGNIDNYRRTYFPMITDCLIPALCK